jgi:hypothetical protein
LINLFVLPSLYLAFGKGKRKREAQPVEAAAATG